MKHFLRAFKVWWKPKRKFGRIRVQGSENPRRNRGFSPARESSQTLLKFSPIYEGKENMFYFFYKIIVWIQFNKEKDDVRRAYASFYIFHKNVNLYKLETANHISHVIFMPYSVMTNQNARSIKIIL